MIFSRELPAATQDCYLWLESHMAKFLLSKIIYSAGSQEPKLKSSRCRWKVWSFQLSWLWPCLPSPSLWCQVPGQWFNSARQGCARGWETCPSHWGSWHFCHRDKHTRVKQQEISEKMILFDDDSGALVLELIQLCLLKYFSLSSCLQD